MIFAPDSMVFPKLIRIRHVFPSRRLPDPARAVLDELQRVGIATLVKPGARIAVAVGSRGIRNIATIAKTVVERVRALGAVPFVVPSMGSQGGATVDGKLHVLAELGVTEASVGAPLIAGVDAVHLGEIEDGCQVYFDRVAMEADGIIAINRVKPHTHAKGGYNESGIVKMLAIGLGNYRGTQSLHAYGFPRLAHRLTQAAELIIAKAPVLLGLAIVEDAYDDTAIVEAIRPADFIERDHHLLQVAYAHMPVLPSERLDVVAFKWIGKNISGPGMDPNITGRGELRTMPDMYSKPVIGRVVALDLSEGSCGNAAGISAADYITQKLYRKIDLHDTYVNCIASSLPEVARIPPILADDREAIYAALVTYGRPEPLAAKLAIADSTLDMVHLLVSPALHAEIGEREDVQAVSPAEDFKFDGAGNLLNETRDVR